MAYKSVDQNTIDQIAESLNIMREEILEAINTFYQEVPRDVQEQAGITYTVEVISTNIWAMLSAKGYSNRHADYDSLINYLENYDDEDDEYEDY